MLLHVYRKYRYPFHKGVFPHHNAVPATAFARRDNGWRTSAVDPSRYQELPVDALQEHAFLGPLAAVVSRQNGGRLRLLDFGGGLGIGYAHLRHCLAPCALDYHIVDLEWARREGTRLHGNDPCIHFHTSLPLELPSVDIVYVAEALQYIEDYAGLLSSLCAYRAPFVLLAGVYAGNFTRYATAQLSVPGAILPFWLLNLTELIQIMQDNGYALILNGIIGGPIPNQDDFPQELRLTGGRARVLLFAPESPA